MRGLGRSDLRAGLDFIAFLGEAAGLDDYANRLAFGLEAVIPCDNASYNEINRRRRRARWISGVDTNSEHVAAFERHLPEHPFVNYFARHPYATAMRISDLIGFAKFRSLGVYSDLYHPLHLERILGLEIVVGELHLAVAAFRDGREFSERDRTMLTLLRPHLTNAYGKAATLSDLGARLELLQNGLDIAGLGAIVLARGNRVQMMTATARTWLAAYFGSAGTGNILPEPVLDWLGAGAAMPLLVEREGRRLALQLVRRGTLRLVLMREQRTSLQPVDLAPLGLTRREAEILTWLVRGKTDADIAAILAISPRTVSHTLERVYRKLGVATRVAATICALRATAFTDYLRPGL